MAKVAIVHYKSKTYKDGHPVLLRVTHRSKPKYYTLKPEFVCKESHWNDEAKEFRKSFGKNYTRANLVLAKRKSDAQKIIIEIDDQNKPFSFESFEKKMFNEQPDLMLIDYFDKIIAYLNETDNVRNAEVYKTTRNVLSTHLEGHDMLMRDFDYKRLMLFQTFLRKRGNADTTIGVRMRTLRALFHKARKEEGLENYPFKNYNFGDLNLETRKRAISSEDLIKIFNFKPRSTIERDTIEIFKFMFFAQGINFGDISRLENNNIRNGTIFYKRKKTKKNFSIHIHKDIQLILNHFKKNQKSNKYLFPILQEDIHKTEQQKVYRIKRELKTYNRTIQIIANKVGVEQSKEITTNVMRHTWATVARNMDISESIISESMGHKDIKTTRIYLASFDQETINEANRKVADVLKNEIP